MDVIPHFVSGDAGAVVVPGGRCVDVFFLFRGRDGKGGPGVGCPTLLIASSH